MMAAPAGQVGIGGLDGIHRSRQVGCQYALPVLGGQAPDAPAAVKTGVIDQYVQPSPGLNDPGNHRRHGSRVGDIATTGQAVLTQLRGKLLKVGVARDNRNLGALGQGLSRRRQADAPGCPGNEPYALMCCCLLQCGFTPRLLFACLRPTRLN